MRFSWTVIGLIPLSLAAAIQAGDWPQILGPDRSGQSEETGLITRFPPAGPKVLWSRAIGAGFAGPAVQGDRLILFHRTEGQERVEAIHAKTGETQWTTDYPATYRDDFGFDNGPRAVPTIADGHVYTLGADGVLQCLQLDEGSLRWRIDCKKEFGADKGFFGFASSPIIADGVVVANIGGQPDAGIVGLDTTTGKERWRATDDEGSYSSPILWPGQDRDGKSVIAFTREGLVQMNPISGRVLFEKRWRSSMQASVNAALPAATPEGLFLSSSYGTGAVLLVSENGSWNTRWSGDQQLSNHYATSVFFQGHLYGFHGRQEYGPSLRCIEAATGNVRWDEGRFGGGTLIVADGRLWILHEDGELVIAEATPERYREVSRNQILGNDTRAYPAFANGVLYARDPRRLVAIDLNESPK